MKKLISIALVLVMVLSLSVVAFAANTKTVYCKAPDSWTDCYVHAWGDGGDLTGGWPGAPATKDSNGLWKYDVPAEATKIIFHNNAGTQTGDMDMPTDDKVKYDYAAKTWVALNEEAVKVEQYYVAGVAALCGEEWAPASAANAMTKGTDGVWSKTYKGVAAGTYELKVTDGSWDTTWGVYNEAESKVDNASITLEATSDVTVMLNPKTQLMQIKIGDKTTDYPHPSTGNEDNNDNNQNDNNQNNNNQNNNQNNNTQNNNTQNNNVTTGNRTLTVKAPASWSNVHVYTWEPEDFGKFPGSPMPKSGSEYKTSIKNTMVNLIVSTKIADDNIKKTDDIKLETNGKNVVITVNEDCTYKIEYAGGSNTSAPRREAAADPTGKNLSIYRVVGNTDWMGNWDAASDKGRMYDMGNGLYRVNFDNVAPGSYQLKITKDGKWDNAYGENGNNYTFTIDAKGKITVDFTLKDGVGVIDVYGLGVNPGTADISLISVMVLLALASAAAIVLVVNKKKFI